MTMNKKNIPLLKSFWCAIKGIVNCFLNERNFRIHLCACFYVIWLGSFYNFSLSEKAVLAVVIGFVMVTEVLNTSIENLVDLVCPEKNKQAGMVKDIAAGAVLLSALTAVVVAFIMFWDIDILRNVFTTLTDKVSNILLFISSVIFWGMIIFYKKKDKKGTENNEN